MASRLKLSSPSDAKPNSTLLPAVQCLLGELCSLFAGELNPVAAKAQRKVPVPEGLDLDAWINEPPPPPPLHPVAGTTTPGMASSHSSPSLSEHKSKKKGKKVSCPSFFY